MLSGLPGIYCFVLSGHHAVYCAVLFGRPRIYRAVCSLGFKGLLCCALKASWDLLFCARLALWDLLFSALWFPGNYCSVHSGPPGTYVFFVVLSEPPGVLLSCALWASWDLMFCALWASYSLPCCAL